MSPPPSIDNLPNHKAISVIAMKLLTPPHPSMLPERLHSIPNSTQQNFSKQTPALVYVVCLHSGKKVNVGVNEHITVQKCPFLPFYCLE